MAANSDNQPKRRRGPGRPFEAGRSGNPDGFSKETRAKRLAISQALDDAFTVTEIVDGKKVPKDLLIEAIKTGVSVGEPSMVRLACEYRYGKPVQPVEGEMSFGGASLEQLLEQLPEALKVLGVK